MKFEEGFIENTSELAIRFLLNHFSPLLEVEFSIIRIALHIHTHKNSHKIMILKISLIFICCTLKRVFLQSPVSLTSTYSQASSWHLLFSTEHWICWCLSKKSEKIAWCRIGTCIFALDDHAFVVRTHVVISMSLTLHRIISFKSILYRVPHSVCSFNCHNMDSRLQV